LRFSGILPHDSLDIGPQAFNVKGASAHDPANKVVPRDWLSRVASSEPRCSRSSSIARAQIPLVVLHHFSGTTTEGAFPAASLIQAADGNFYGTTADGGPSGTGTIFKMSPTGAVTTLHTFGDIPDGDYPYGPLIQATDGNFYGMTSGGGPNFGGTIFRMTPSGNVTILQTLDLFGAGGHSPSRSLIQATDGNLYGMTENGGASNRGTIFKMTLAERSRRCTSSPSRTAPFHRVGSFRRQTETFMAPPSAAAAGQAAVGLGAAPSSG